MELGTSRHCHFLNDHLRHWMSHFVKRPLPRLLFPHVYLALSSQVGGPTTVREMRGGDGSPSSIKQSNE